MLNSLHGLVPLSQTVLLSPVSTAIHIFNSNTCECPTIQLNKHMHIHRNNTTPLKTSNMPNFKPLMQFEAHRFLRYPNI